MHAPATRCAVACSTRCSSARCPRCCGAARSKAARWCTIRRGASCSACAPRWPICRGRAADYDELAFGGSLDPDSPIHGRHACPGYGMGVGVLLALLSALFDAGTLRPTGSPVLLMLTPR